MSDKKEPIFRLMPQRDKDLAPIDWETQAKPMIREYVIHPNRLKIEVPDAQGNPVKQTLKGLRISRADIEDIFINTDVAELFVMLGVRPGDVGQSQNNQYFTTIFCGIDVNNEIQTGIVKDFCDPCPTSCPKVGSSSPFE